MYQALMKQRSTASDRGEGDVLAWSSQAGVPPEEDIARVMPWQRWLTVFMCALLAVDLLYLGVVASRLPVDYWDGYEYLMNARTLAGHEYARLHHNYLESRPPLIPLLLAVVLQGYRPGGLGTSLWGPHLLALALSALSIVALYWLMRQAFSPNGSLVGCLVLAMNPLFIHYAPFVMTDIPAMFLVTLAAVAYLRASQTGRLAFQVFSGAALGAAVSVKYTTLFVVGGLGLFEVLRVLYPPCSEDPTAPGLGRRAWRLVVSPRPWVVLAVAWAVFYLLHGLAYARAMPGVHTLAQIIIVFRNQMGGVGKYMSDPLFEYLVDLRIAFSLPLCAAALAGMVVAARDRMDVDLLCFGWLVVFFGVITFLIGHKEVRYAFPILPPLIYFVTKGIRAFWTGTETALSWLLGRRTDSALRVTLASALVVLAVTAQPAVLAARELARFSDPVYAKPFLPTVARWVLDHSAPGQRVLISRGFIYTMYPAEPLFSPYDEFFYFHHIPGAALAYLLDRPLVQADLVLPVSDDTLPALVDRFAHSEVMLWSGLRYLDTNGIFLGIEPPDALRLASVDRRTLKPESDADATSTRRVYQATDGPERLVLARTGDAWGVVEGMPEKSWRPYQRETESAPATAFEPRAADNPPAVIELIRVEQLEASFR
jgi:4-amino-4-deoxy-L-arabinose transferase-like glycosyltransferase